MRTWDRGDHLERTAEDHKKGAEDHKKGASQTRVPDRAAQGRHRAGTALKSQINVGCSREDHK
jgi:hypothetical protein